MESNPDTFSKIANSLKQYRRAELADFETELGGNPIDKLYVDPLESQAVIKTLLQNNSTFVIGRKGTGKSTVFARAQDEIRRKTDTLSIYVDVKTLHELVSDLNNPIDPLTDTYISPITFKAHRLRKEFLGAVIEDIIKSIDKAYETRSLIQKWTGGARGYHEVISELKEIADNVRGAKLTQEELPILRRVSIKEKIGVASKEAGGQVGKIEVGLGVSPEVKSSAEASGYNEKIADAETYQEYADVVLRTFPFQSILEKIQELLKGVGLKKLFIFFDDFSELMWIDQKLFVDVILSPLNNASNEAIKLKVAGYPGRVYYGKIDPGKIDTIFLDFYRLYESSDIQTSEAQAINYLERLLETRFAAFGESVKNYFDAAVSLEDFYRQIFEITLNVPRLIGYLLHYVYLDRVSKRQLITPASLRLAAQKYHENVVKQYFDRMNRYALEPFDRKLDRHNQKQLLDKIVQEAKAVRRGIATGQIGGKYFEGLSNPPVSHFSVSRDLEGVFSSLELNFLVTKYHEMRDKNGKDVTIYSLSYGLCEAERLPWGYPRGRRDDRSYFVQRCFNYNSTVHAFLEKNQTLRCDDCAASFGMDKKQNIEFYKWKCPECNQGTCSVVTLGDDFKAEVRKLDMECMLAPVELEILEVLHDEATAMRAGEIAHLVDATYQLVGKRTSKLNEMGLVQKRKRDVVRNSLTDKAKNMYFSDEDGQDSEEYD